MTERKNFERVEGLMQKEFKGRERVKKCLGRKRVKMGEGWMQKGRVVVRKS